MERGEEQGTLAASASYRGGQLGALRHQGYREESRGEGLFEYPSSI